MLFKLALKNISKSIKDYAIYFCTLILGVAIFYVFNAIDDQTVMMSVSSSTYQIIKLMTNILSGVSVFVSLILGFLIVYASRFLIKRRNKEFGIYLTLGMSKRKISLILFIETLIIGFISLFVGLGLGFLLSQLMSIVVANMFEADLTKFHFIFSLSACVKTLIYFSIMYFVVMIFNTININRCRLIDLLHFNKKSEKIRLKNPYVCTIIFIVSCCALGFAYYEVTGGIGKLTNVNNIFEPIIIGTISTFLIFWSLSGLILKIFMNIKSIYYKGLNSFTLRQFSSKINTMIFSMTVICLMLFITICVLSSALSMKNSMSNNLKKLAPADIEFTKKIDITNDSKYSVKQVEDSKVSIEESLKQLNFDIDSNLKDTVNFNVYVDQNLTVKDTLGNYYEISKEKYPLLIYNNIEELITISDYNKIAKIFNLKEYTLENDEYIIVSNYQEWSKIRNEGLKLGTNIIINGKLYKPKFLNCMDGFYEMNASYANFGFFVVPDTSVTGLMKEKEVMIANYNAKTTEQKKKIDNMISKLDEEPYIKNTTLEARTKTDIAEASLGLGGMATFIGLYLGIIFLISCAAILALKELSESSDNLEKFKMLRKIGVDEKMINKALFRQIGIFFMFPLLVAIIHSIFGIQFCNFILSAFGNEKMLQSIIITSIFIIAIYGGYFLITYICSKNIIRER
ncbi:MAG: ABC transporter permease [bacterium]|nr:ABC transporter permease [bacterium]